MLLQCARLYCMQKFIYPGRSKCCGQICAHTIRHMFIVVQTDVLCFYCPQTVCGLLFLQKKNTRLMKGVIVRDNRGVVHTQLAHWLEPHIGDRHRGLSIYEVCLPWESGPTKGRHRCSVKTWSTCQASVFSVSQTLWQCTAVFAVSYSNHVKTVVRSHLTGFAINRLW